MNCPHHIQIYESSCAPIAICRCAWPNLARSIAIEQSGELNGLLRTRDFTVDDSHIFVTPEQVEDEYMRVIELALFVFEALQLRDFTLRVGLRDASSKYVGSDEAWEKAQAVIMRAVDKLALS